MADIVIRPPDAGEIESRAAGVEDSAMMLVVSDGNSYEAGLIFVRDLVTRAAAITDLFKESKLAAHRAHRSICELESRAIEPYMAARDIVQRKCLAWKKEAEERARIEQQRIQADLRKQEEERRLSEAVELEDAGENEEAALVLDQPGSVPYVTVEPDVVKVAGVSTRKVWKARVLDFAKLLEFCAKHEGYHSLIRADDSALGRLATATRGNLKIPGVDFYQQESIGVRPSTGAGRP